MLGFTSRATRNDGEPGVVNSAPYEAGWLLEITLSDPSEMDGLLDAAGYRDQVG